VKKKIYRLLGRTLLPVALATVLTFLMLPAGVWADEGTNAAEGAALGPVGETGEWTYFEADTPTGKLCRLFEYFGGFWADAEKDPNPGDDLLCWAATASNMLEYTGWGFVGGMEFGNTDDFFQFYRGHVTDKGYYIDLGISWWFDGELPPVPPYDVSQEVVDHLGFWSPTYDPGDYIFSDGDAANALYNIQNEITGGRPVGLAVYPLSGPGGHAITCWGFNYDDTYTPQDIEYYLGLWVSDSDSHKHMWNPPDMLAYYAVSWNATGNRWELPSYGCFIGAVHSLAVFPGATRPTANAGGPYIGYEGTPVTFDASGSTDDDTLWYRWDLDNDGVWDTGWLTSATAEWTWDDDRNTENVYLEVFDERLRDMSTAPVTIFNVAPEVTALGDVIDENGRALVSGSIYDPGSLDTFTVAIDWGDGSWDSYDKGAGTTWFSEYHQYLDDNPTGTPSDVYNVTVTVIDDDGGIGTAYTTVTVSNVDPVVQEPYISGQPNAEFILPVVHEVDFAAAFADVGTLDTHTAVWDWGDGTTSIGLVAESGGSGNVTGSHTYALPGDYTVTVTVTDDDGGVDYNTLTLHIADVAEALDILDAYIQSLPNSSFACPGTARLCKAAFHKMFLQLDVMLAFRSYRWMTYYMNFNMRTKFDGTMGGIKRDDWIKQDLALQTDLCQKVDDITAYLEYLARR
jgi:hypothetical protein